MRYSAKVAVVAALPVLGVGAALLFAWSGVYNIAASRGHWDITLWFLTFAMRNSVETHSRAIEPPPLDDPSLRLRGLGHYDRGCAPCHGAPGERPNPIALHSVPKPPYLPDEVSSWEPEELFWIVMNGLKYTGMPAWPAPQRDDEVWAVVAALLALPELGGKDYRSLVQGEVLLDFARLAQDARSIATTGKVGEDLLACARCHGLRGEGRGGGAFPRLAGQSEAYLTAALQAFALGLRPSGIMGPVAAELSDPEIRTLARYFASLPDAPRLTLATANADGLRRGRAIAEQGVPEAGVPACAACHGPKASARNPLYPSLAGQAPRYLARQLRLFRRGVFSVTPEARVMAAMARSLTDEQIEAVSAFYGTGGSAPEPEAAQAERWQ